MTADNLKLIDRLQKEHTQDYCTADAINQGKQKEVGGRRKLNKVTREYLEAANRNAISKIADANAVDADQDN